MFSCITVLNYISVKVYWKTGFSIFGQNARWHAVLSWRTLQYCTVYLGKQVSSPRSPERCCWTVVVRGQQLCCSCRLDVASWSWQYSRCLSAWWTTSIYTCLAYLYWWVLCDLLTSTPVKCRSTCRVGSLNPCSSTHSLDSLIIYLSPPLSSLWQPFPDDPGLASSPLVLFLHFEKNYYYFTHLMASFLG